MPIALNFLALVVLFWLLVQIVLSLVLKLVGLAYRRAAIETEHYRIFLNKTHAN